MNAGHSPPVHLPQDTRLTTRKLTLRTSVPEPKRNPNLTLNATIIRILTPSPDRVACVSAMVVFEGRGGSVRGWADVRSRSRKCMSAGGGRRGVLGCTRRLIVFVCTRHGCESARSRPPTTASTTVEPRTSPQPSTAATASCSACQVLT